MPGITLVMNGVDEDYKTQSIRKKVDWETVPAVGDDVEVARSFMLSYKPVNRRRFDHQGRIELHFDYIGTMILKKALHELGWEPNQ